jgi:rhodanese-related sulfurtransferase
MTGTNVWCSFQVIDVRTPLEYSEDHIPGAINLPILSNEQRVIVIPIHIPLLSRTRQISRSESETVLLKLFVCRTTTRRSVSCAMIDAGRHKVC